jgi:hypothetical protein
MGLQLDFQKYQPIWFDSAIPFHPINLFQDPSTMQYVLQVSPAAVSPLEAFSASFMQSTYFKANNPQVVAQQTHQTPSQCNDLQDILDCHAPLFRGKIGTYPHEENFLIILKPDAVPFYQQRPFPVALKHFQLLKEELNWQEGKGIIACCFKFIWCMPSFILPKKDNQICLILDLCKLNSGILHQQYILPQIQDIFLCRHDYKFLTKINLSMQYYSFVLN